MVVIPGIPHKAAIKSDNKLIGMVIPVKAPVIFTSHSTTEPSKTFPTVLNIGYLGLITTFMKINSKINPRGKTIRGKFGIFSPTVFVLSLKRRHRSLCFFCFSY